MVMRFTILTLFPEAFESITSISLFGRALDSGLLELDFMNIRDFAPGKHRVVDDTPYGGGAGMVMKVEPVALAISSIKSKSPNVKVALLTPQGRVFTQAMARDLAKIEHLALLCGRYEGIDDRVRSFVDLEISIGDYILSGGEPAAWVVMDSVSRLVPGVVGCHDSVEEESFTEPGLLEYPQYTRPREYGGVSVPNVLLNGDHGEIAKWRRRQALLNTARNRPDLLDRGSLTDQERAVSKENAKETESVMGDEEHGI